MTYTIRPGIVSREVCDEFVLVATGEAKEFCPKIRQLNATGAFFWRLIEQGCDDETMVRDAAEHFDITPERVRDALPKFISLLRESNYLLSPEEN